MVRRRAGRARYPRRECDVRRYVFSGSAGGDADELCSSSFNLVCGAGIGIGSVFDAADIYTSVFRLGGKSNMVLVLLGGSVMGESPDEFFPGESAHTMR